MPISSSYHRYNINLRRKEAIVHSVIQTQRDLQDTLVAVSNFQDTLDNLATLQNPAIRGVLDQISLSIYAAKAQLTRTIDITLAHSEEIHPNDIRKHCPDPDDLPPPHCLPKDRLYLLPLSKEVLQDPNLGDINHILNPSEYTPDDEDFNLTTDLVDCCFDHEPTVYIHSTKTEHDFLSPTFNSPFKSPDELTKFYCQLPPPSDVPSNIPDKGNALDRTGNPFYKKLQTNDCVYSPSTKTFARVFSWTHQSVQVQVISNYRAYAEVFEDPSKFKRYKESWLFGDFCIALNHLQERKYLAYVSPYTRAESHPFVPPSDPATLAPEPVQTKRKLN